MMVTRHIALCLALSALQSLTHSAPPEMKPPYCDVKGEGSLIVCENPVPSGSYAEVSYQLAKDDTIQWEVSPAATKMNQHVTIDKKDSTGTAVLYFNGPPGSYTVTAFVINFKAEKFERRKVNVKIGSPTPPKPDDPPSPVPNSELKKKIKEALDLDKGDKADMIQLAALYREAAKLVVKKVESRYDVPSSRELLRRVRESSATLIGTDVLTNVRTVIAGELAGALGMPSDDELTEVQRRSVSDTFLKLAATIESLY